MITQSTTPEWGWPHLDLLALLPFNAAPTHALHGNVSLMQVTVSQPYLLRGISLSIRG